MDAKLPGWTIRPEPKEARVKPSPEIPCYVELVVSLMRAGIWKHEPVWNKENGQWEFNRPARSPKTGEKIRWREEYFERDKHLWGSYQEAYAAYKADADSQGIALLIEPQLRIEINGKKYYPVFFDLDDSYDPETGEVAPWAMEIIERLETYTEISPSGKGIRCIALIEDPKERMKVFYTPDGTEFVPERDVPKDKRDDYHRVEVYGGGIGSNHLITITCSPLFDRPVRKVQGWIDENAPLYEDGEEADVQPDPLDISDEEILQRMLSSKDGDLIKQFMDGDERLWDGEGSRYASRSHADQGLFRKLAFYTRGDKEQMIRIANSSKMRRRKWNRDGYLESLVADGIRYCKGEFYDPEYSSKEKLLDGLFQVWMGYKDPKLRRAFGALLARVKSLGWYSHAGYVFEAHGEKHIIPEDGLLVYASHRDQGLWMGEDDIGNISRTMKALVEVSLVQMISKGKGSKGTLYLIPSSLIQINNIEEKDSPLP